MLAKMIDKIVSLKETKIFEIDGQTYADTSLTRIPPHVDRPDCISVSGLDSICKLIRTGAREGRHDPSWCRSRATTPSR